MSNFKTNILSVYSVNIVNGVLGIVFIPLSLKLFGADGYGLYSVYVALASLIGLADIGISKNLQRLLASERDISTQRVHLQNTFAIYIVQSCLLACFLPGLMVALPIYVFPVATRTLVTLRWIMFFAVFEYIIAIPTVMMQTFCIANERFDRYSAFTLVSGVTRYILMFFGLFAFRSPIIVIGLIVSRRFIDVVIAKRVMLSMPHGVWHPNFSYHGFKTILTNSVGLSLGQALQTTIISVGTLLVNNFFGLEALGKYRAAFDLTSKIWFISNGVGLVAFPGFVKTITIPKRKEQFYSKLYCFMNVSWEGFNLVSIIGTMLASFVLGFLHIHDSQIMGLFVILLLPLCLNAHANLSYELLQADRRYISLSFVGVLSLTILLLSFYSLQRTYGIYAIGWAWMLSQIGYSMASDLVVLSAFNFHRTHIIKITIIKTAILMVSLLMLAIYLGVLSNKLRFLPLIGASIFFLFSLNELKSTLQRPEQTLDA